MVVLGSKVERRTTFYVTSKWPLVVVLSKFMSPSLFAQCYLHHTRRRYYAKFQGIIQFHFRFHFDFFFLIYHFATLLHHQHLCIHLHFIFLSLPLSRQKIKGKSRLYLLPVTARAATTRLVMKYLFILILNLQRDYFKKIKLKKVK